MRLSLLTFNGSLTVTLLPSFLPTHLRVLNKFRNLRWRNRRSLLHSLRMPVMSQFLPGLEMGKGMYFLFIKSESITPGGLLARPSLTATTRVPISSTALTIPIPAPRDHLLPGLLPKYVLSSTLLAGPAGSCPPGRAIFASAFIPAITFLEKHWELMCNDIRVGFPNPTIINDPAVEEAVKRVLGGPDPDLEGLIEVECSKEPWQGILTRLWPNTKYVDVIVTGTMAQYVPMLDYYNGRLPLVSIMYASSECCFGLNLNPFCDPSSMAYTILPNMAYFEFLPVEHIDISVGTSMALEEKLVDLVDVELGNEYELVITTYTGLYRYRVGDILKVAGFKNKAPQFNFVRRKNVALSIDSDKTDEVELHNAVKKAVNAHLSTSTLVDYTSYADMSTIPGHYVIFWEIDSKLDDFSVLEKCCVTVEEALNSVYRQCRVADKSIGALEIRAVERGTFDKLMDYVLTLGTSISQYKTPRCVTYPPIIQLLNANVVGDYFSRECPKWEPAAHKLTTC